MFVSLDSKNSMKRFIFTYLLQSAAIYYHNILFIIMDLEGEIIMQHICVCVCVCVCMFVAKSCPTLGGPKDCSIPDCSAP